MKDVKGILLWMGGIENSKLDRLILSDELDMTPLESGRREECTIWQFVAADLHLVALCVCYLWLCFLDHLLAATRLRRW